MRANKKQVCIDEIARRAGVCSLEADTLDQLAGGANLFLRMQTLIGFWIIVLVIMITVNYKYFCLSNRLIFFFF